jgi:hypothetical protein
MQYPKYPSNILKTVEYSQFRFILYTWFAAKSDSLMVVFWVHALADAADGATHEGTL